MKFLEINIFRLFLYLSLIGSTVLILSCSDSTAPVVDQGQIKITLVDSPGDFDEVNIVVTRVEVHRAGSDSSSGWFVINNNEEIYNLLSLRNGASAVLGNSPIDAGHYTQIRLIIGTGSNVVVDGNVYSLDISSGSVSGVKLNKEFEIQEGLVYELTFDFDADHSIILTSAGHYKLKPVIRMVPTIISGSISGMIIPKGSRSYIYAVSGTEEVSAVTDINTGSFKIMALLQGTYNLKVISTNESYRDTTISNVAVVAKQNTDFGIITLHLK